MATESPIDVDQILEEETQDLPRESNAEVVDEGTNETVTVDAETVDAETDNAEAVDNVGTENTDAETPTVEAPTVEAPAASPETTEPANVVEDLDGEEEIQVITTGSQVGTATATAIAATTDTADTADDATANLSETVDKKHKKSKRKRAKRDRKRKKFERDDHYRYDVKPEPVTEYADELQSICTTLREGVGSALDAESVSSITQKLEAIAERVRLTQAVGRSFRKKDQMLCAFTMTAQKSRGLSVVTRSDYDRKYVECPRAIEDLFGDGVYGNPIGVDVTFAFKSMAEEYIDYMTTLKDTTQRPEQERLMFGAYRLDSVRKLPKSTPSYCTMPHSKTAEYEMIMTDTETGMSISCRACDSSSLSKETHKTRVDDIDYSGKDIFNSIHDLSVKRAVLNYNLYSGIKMLKGTMVRNKRATILMRVVQTMEETCRMLDQGYKYIDIGNNKMFKFNIEKKEPCPITMCDPPYINMFMHCGHTLSLGAFKGIILKGASSSTESIVCPMCRENLIPETMDIFTGDNEVYDTYYNVCVIAKKDLLEKPIDASKYNLEKRAVTKNALFSNIRTSDDTDEEEDDPVLSVPSILQGFAVDDSEHATGSFIVRSGELDGSETDDGIAGGPAMAMPLSPRALSPHRALSRASRNSNNSDVSNDSDNSNDSDDTDGEEFAFPEDSGDEMQEMASAFEAAIGNAINNVANGNADSVNVPPELLMMMAGAMMQDSDGE